MKSTSRVMHPLLDFLFSDKCPACGERKGNRRGVLHANSEDAGIADEGEGPLCLHCNIHMPRTGYGENPRDNNMALEYSVVKGVEKAGALFFYRPASSYANVVYAIKYHKAYWLGEQMGKLMAQEYSQTDFFEDIDAIVPLPISTGRRMKRGYNQSEYIARGISLVTGIPIVRHAVLRKDFVTSQTSLTREQRQNNVADAFIVADAQAIRDKHVLLVDDVVTTGATTKACAAKILELPGTKVSVLALGYAGKK